MVKIGILGGRLGETNPSYPYRKWMDQVPEEHNDGDWILNEAALVAAIEHKYSDAEVKYLRNFNEKTLQKNDVNFLVGVNLLNAWHGSSAQHKKWLAIMKNKKNNIYPPLSEQYFLYNKGDYLKYYEKKGVPIAPTFLIKKERDASKIIQEVRKNGWKGFIVKPDYAFANIEISKYELENDENTFVTESYYSDDLSIPEKTESFYSDISDEGKDEQVRKELNKYLTKTKKFPGLVCQEKIEGFVHKWEVKSFWIHGEYKYHVAMKAWPPPESFGNVSKKSLEQIKKIAKKVYDNYPETKIKGKVVKPLFLRIDLGCCQGNTLDSTKYFLNEIEYAGCGTFTDVKNVFHYWPEAYYTKAIELSNL
uniref:ATP-grasp domain-containing protein n=1 Tax=viral metagenome TaxID=1070528 RepID=A0A6C0L2B0_9ZZZZ|tara:strand:- start:17446 stop:18537 length:1092 start_codon:yes stop_codon:yes gene_type:complete